MTFERQGIAQLREVAQDIAELRAASALPEQTPEVPCDLCVVLARDHPEDAEQGVFGLSGTERRDGKQEG